MEIAPHQMNRLFYLLGALRDEIITAAEFAELNALLEKNETIRQIYLDYIYLCTDLCNLQAAAKPENAYGLYTTEPQAEWTKPELTLEMLQILGDYERNAETLTIPKPPEEKPIIHKMPVKMPPRKLSRMSILSFAVSLAALLFLIAYVHLGPRPSYEVATLVNSVDAQWSFDGPLQKGIRLSASSSEPIELKTGFIEIATDKQVAVTIEAPAKFTFLSADEIRMHYGRLYATVSPAGNGFAVSTLNSKIIDLGTEFGVSADQLGQTELHVFKGNTVLIAGHKGQHKKTVEVTAGHACRVASIDSRITDIDLNQNLFAQGIDPDSGLLITGGKQIDLADIVGGGNGSGNGLKNRGIQWDGTKLTSNMNPLPAHADTFPTDFVPVTCNPLIDGIFVPNCKGAEPLTLTSDAATLNLDDFIAADTNGQLTFLLLLEDPDDDAIYWFNAKEAAQNSTETYPALIFPNASPAGPVRITTAHGNGADADVANDWLRGPSVELGNTPSLSCRHRQGENKRIRITYLRFDIRDLKSDLTNAVLSLHLAYGNRNRDLAVYGLMDGPADKWDEGAINFLTAPGLLPAGLGTYRLDENALRRLGTFQVTDNRLKTDPIRVATDYTCSWKAPDTLCRSAYVISNAENYRDQNNTVRPLILDKIACGTDQNPAIFMHANAGITFDLDAIRRGYGPVDIKSFTAVCGMATSPEMLEQPSASIYVLINGQEVFSALDITPADPPQQIDVKLSRQARYLTLIATQGTDHSIRNDVCLFAKPVLTLK